LICLGQNQLLFRAFHKSLRLKQQDKYKSLSLNKKYFFSL
jgi:hypothetical protein